MCNVEYIGDEELSVLSATRRVHNLLINIPSRTHQQQMTLIVVHQERRVAYLARRQQEVVLRRDGIDREVVDFDKISRDDRKLCLRPRQPDRLKTIKSNMTAIGILEI